MSNNVLRLLLGVTLIFLTMLLQSCASGLVKNRQPPIPDGVEACIVKDKDCEFDAGQKIPFKDDRPRRAAEFSMIHGWIALPPNVFIDLIREFPEVSID